MQLVEVLAAKGGAAQTAYELGWHTLDDAELLRQASASHAVLLTRDRRFGQTARSAIDDAAIPVVVLQFPQMPWAGFAGLRTSLG